MYFFDQEIDAQYFLVCLKLQNPAIETGCSENIENTFHAKKTVNRYKDLLCTK